MNKIFVMMLFLIPVSSFAQGGGHVGFFGRIFGPGQQQQQQQQQQSGPIDFYKVIRGEEAKAIYESLLIEGKAKEIIRDQECSEPVTELRNYIDQQYFDCFDRGENFARSSRFKCYKQVKKDPGFFTGVRAMFRIMPKKCGGDGIYPVNSR